MLSFLFLERVPFVLAIFPGTPLEAFRIQPPVTKMPTMYMPNALLFDHESPGVPLQQLRPGSCHSLLSLKAPLYFFVLVVHQILRAWSHKPLGELSWREPYPGNADHA